MTKMPADVRQSVQDLMTEYCYRVDDLVDLEALLALFADDAVIDMTGIGLPALNDASAIRTFYAAVFEDMTNHAHYITNFRPESWDGKEAVMTAYVIGLGRASDGNEVDVKVFYRMHAVETGGTWKITRYEIHPKMPLPGSLGEIHGER